VLLSDRIEQLAKQYKLIEPFSLSKLKPAAYELSVGDLYSIGGKTFRLSEDPTNNEILIRPFEVVIIQTLERLNLPQFLIARWNVRVRWAYEGLLWVGAAQVDPGFKGYLACPLYNLSDKDIRLHRGDEIAVIDFVTTTQPTPDSKKYDPYKRTRILFEDYQPDRLRSALATEAKQRVDAFEFQLKNMSLRMDSFAGIFAGALGILVAVLALFVGNQLPEEFKRVSPALMVSAGAFAIAFVSLLLTSYRHLATPGRGRWIFGFSIVLIIALLVAILWLELRRADFTSRDRPTQTRQAPIPK
jgi:deoxycytidine triphosphate deaminase